MTQSFNFEQALEDLKSGKDLNGKDGILTPLKISRGQPA